MFTSMILSLERDLYRYLRNNYELTRTDVLILLASGIKDSTLYSLSVDLAVDRSLISKRIRILEEKKFIFRESTRGSKEKKIINLMPKAHVVKDVLSGFMN